MMLKKLALLIVICLIPIASPVPSKTMAQSEQQIPYLYYFSPDYQAFIIERADGVDSRLLGDGLMPIPADGYNSIAQSAWSVSGQWFAWTVAIRGPYGHWLSENTFLLSADGSRRIPAFDEYEHVRFQWSPQEDLLFAVGANTERQETYTYEEDYLLINPQTGETSLIFSPTPTTATEYEDGGYIADYIAPAIRWARNGQHVAVSKSGSEQVTIINREGQMHQLNITNPILAQEPSQFGYYGRVVPENMQMIYHGETDLIVQDAVHQTSLSFDDIPVQQAFWADDGQYALLMGEGVWLLSMPDERLTLIDADFAFEVPDSIDPPRIWSPDSQHALLWNTSGELFHFDLAQQNLTILDVETRENYPTIYWQWIQDNVVAVSSLYDYNARQKPLYFYNFGTVEEQIIDLVEPLERLETDYVSFYGDRFQMSPDGHVLAFINEGAVLYDLEADTIQGIRPDYNSFFANYGGEVYWHPDGEWLLVHEDGLVAGGGFIRHIGVLSRDGQIRRDLGDHVRWLPEQVTPDQLPPPPVSPLFPQPTQVLHGDTWQFYISWRLDGEQLITGLDLWFGGDTDLIAWNLETQTSTVVFEAVPTSKRVGWETDTGGHYVPVLVDAPSLEGYEAYQVKAFSPDGQQVVIYDNNQGLSIYEVDGNTTGEMLLTLTNSTITSVSYSPDGRLIAFGSQWKRVEIWDVQTGEQLVTLPNNGAGVAFSPDGAYLAVTISWDIQIWDVGLLLGE